MIHSPAEVSGVTDDSTRSFAAAVKVIERLGMTRFDVVPGLLGPMSRYRRTR